MRATDHLDGLHVVFGDMIYGDKVLRAIEVAGSKCGKTTSEITIHSCGQIYDYEK